MSTPAVASYSRIAVDLNPPVAQITLAHPSHNVIDFLMMDELQNVLNALEEQSHISTIVFLGGEDFSAGVDIPSHTVDQAAHMLSKFHGVILTLARSRKITIAGVRGSCLGGGAELALMCDMVFTSTTARWGFPEVKLGCFPPVAAVALAAAVGQKRAAELVFTGRTINGEEAARIGLANQAVPEPALNRRVNTAIQELSQLSCAALQVAKKAFYAWDSIHFDKGLAKAECIYNEELLQTEDMTEGILAWQEKRRPVWKGR